MKIIKPFAVTSTALVSSTVAAADMRATAGIYNAVTSYALGARVQLGGEINHVYESLTAANLNHAPDVSPASWLDLGATNRWSVFDKSITSQTQATASMSYTLQLSGRNTALALLNLSKVSSVTISALEGLTQVYLATYNVQSPSSGGFWAWFFEPIATKLNFVDFDLPPIANLTVTITLNGAATDLIGCGGIVVGLGQELGGTQFGATVGIVDYSRKTKDAWGNWSVFEGAYSDRGSFQLQIDRVAVDSTKAVLAKYRATPIVYVGSDSYDSTIIYGYFKDFSIAIAYATFSVCTLDIEGLT